MALFAYIGLFLMILFWISFILPVEWKIRVIAFILAIAGGLCCKFAASEILACQKKGFMQSFTFQEINQISDDLPLYLRVKDAKAASGREYSWVSSSQKGKSSRRYSYYPVFEATKARQIVSETLYEAQKELENPLNEEDRETILLQAERKVLQTEEVLFVVEGTIGLYDCRTEVLGLQEAYLQGFPESPEQYLQTYDNCMATFICKVQGRLSPTDTIRKHLEKEGFNIRADAIVLNVDTYPPNIYFLLGYFLLTLSLTVGCVWLIFRANSK